MKISDIIVKMIRENRENQHDICHFLKVYAYAKTIGEGENLDLTTQETLEIAAVLHDIACPLCRVKYGNTNGKYQEAEGMILAREFLREFALPDEIVERVVYLVGHHHTLDAVDGADYQILLEADYLVNAGESSYSAEHIRNTLHTVFKTSTGIALLKSIYGVE